MTFSYRALPFLAKLLPTCVWIMAIAGSVDGQTVVYTDSFDENDDSRWEFKIRQTNQGDARFGFDYSSLGIPEAPNTPSGDATTSGVALRTNVAAGNVDQTGVSLQDTDFSGKYSVQVDMWLNWSLDPTEVGTTEHAGLFVGQGTASNPVGIDTPVQAGAGAIFSSDGDCSNCDHILLKNEAELDIFSGQYNVTLFDETDLNTNPGNQPGFDNTDVNTDLANGDLLDLRALFPAFPIPADPTVTQPAGAVGFRWITIKADIDPTAGAGPGTGIGSATFSVEIADSGESYTLGTVDNSIDDILDDDLDGDECQANTTDDPSEDICTTEAPVDLEGQITLALLDFFPSVARDINEAAAVFDNLIVTAIDDTTLAGDFNGDGRVDAADYTTWRDGLGTTYVQADYAIWAGNYGAVAASAGTSIPEPAALAMLFITATCVAGNVRRRRR